MSHSYDVIVVGAGPAGATAAKLLADAGYHTALVEKARFPRHKTCASWINRLVFERFPYLRGHQAELVDSPFAGIAFLDQDLSRAALWRERRPSGYLSLRSKFDNGLKDIAVAAGAEFHEGCAVEAFEMHDSQVRVRLADGQEFAGKVLVGADGANSRMAALAGMRRGWGEDESVLCANEDIPCDPKRIASFYSEMPPLLVALQFQGLTGYGWVFPKRDHICVGIGGRLRPGERIQELYRRFFEAAQARSYVPAELKSEKVYYAVDPAGGVNKRHPLVRGRLVLVGDAGGFVSGTTGEGIYPGMESARLAAELIAQGFRAGRVEEELRRFETLWRTRLGGYIRDLPGGEQRRQTVDRVGLIFRSRLVCGVAARVFLYGEPAAPGTLLRALLGGRVERSFRPGRG